MAFRGLLFFAAQLLQAVVTAAPAANRDGTQQVLQLHQGPQRITAAANSRKPLNGRFLHITGASTTPPQLLGISCA
jgi:hypothetical protein